MTIHIIRKSNVRLEKTHEQLKKNFIQKRIKMAGILSLVVGPVHNQHFLCLPQKSFNTDILKITCIFGLSGAYSGFRTGGGGATLKNIYICTTHEKRGSWFAKKM